MAHGWQRPSGQWHADLKNSSKYSSLNARTHGVSYADSADYTLPQMHHTYKECCYCFLFCFCFLKNMSNEELCMCKYQTFKWEQKRCSTCYWPLDGTAVLIYGAWADIHVLWCNQCLVVMLPGYEPQHVLYMAWTNVNVNINAREETMFWKDRH